MDKYEMLGFLLQDLRDNHETDEEDLGPAILRETTKIYGLMIRYGHLSRDMFDLTDIGDPKGQHGVSLPYSEYQTTNYPITFVVFANEFAHWLVGEDARESLGFLDLIEMIKQHSPRRIKLVPKDHGILVVVRSRRSNTLRIHEKLLIETQPSKT